MRGTPGVCVSNGRAAGRAPGDDSAQAVAALQLLDAGTEALPVLLRGQAVEARLRVGRRDGQVPVEALGGAARRLPDRALRARLGPIRVRVLQGDAERTLTFALLWCAPALAGTWSDNFNDGVLTPPWTNVQGRNSEANGLFTASGVSAGIDMALHLVGRLWDPATAQRVQKYMEYFPDPPYADVPLP